MSGAILSALLILPFYFILFLKANFSEVFSFCFCFGFLGFLAIPRPLEILRPELNPCNSSDNTGLLTH